MITDWGLGTRDSKFVTGRKVMRKEGRKTRHKGIRHKGTEKVQKAEGK